MAKFRVIEVDDIEKENGFVVGQIVEGELKTVNFPKPNEGEREIFEPYEGEWFMNASHVELAE